MRINHYLHQDINFYTIAILFLIVACIVSTNATAQTPPEYQNRSGEAKDYVVVGPNNYSGNRPVLSSFSFDYLRKDRHFHEVSIFPEYGSGRNQLGFRYSDDNRKHSYRYSISLALVSSANVLAEGTISGLCKQRNAIVRRKGWCARELPAPPVRNAVFVLSAISLRYGSFKDHHVDEFAIYEEDGELWFGLNDKNDDDNFAYSAKYFYLPDSMFVELGQRSASDNGGSSEDFVIASGIPVIRGFWFNYRSSDHHIDRIEINLGLNGRGSVSYDDKNNDDDYYYSIDYGVLRGN